MSDYQKLKIAYDELQKSYDDLQKRYENVYKANEEKKQDNYKLRGKCTYLTNRVYEFTILINTFIKKRRRKKK